MTTPVCRLHGTACIFAYPAGWNCSLPIPALHIKAIAGCATYSGQPTGSVTPTATVTVYRVTRLTKAAKAPVLGDAFTGSVGYGHAHPALISDGGCCASALTFQVRGLHWQHWGDKQTTGIGTGFWLPPSAKSFSELQAATEDVVAYALGICKGKLAYLKMKWFFPGHGGRFSTSHANPICV